VASDVDVPQEGHAVGVLGNNARELIGDVLGVLVVGGDAGPGWDIYTKGILN
jgi:hypothetical protein